jgi:hypothetical protein
MYTDEHIAVKWLKLNFRGAEMEAIEVIKTVHEAWLSKHPDATAQQLLDFLRRVLNDLKAWSRIIPVSVMLKQLDHEASEYLRTIGDASVAVDECQRSVADDIEAVEGLIEEHGANVRFG